MIVNPSYYRHRAKASLKGNWQTAFLVTFFAGIFITLSSMLLSVLTGKLTTNLYDKLISLATSVNNNAVKEAERFAMSLLAQYELNFRSVPMGLWIGVAVSLLGCIFVTPSLKISECNYYLARNAGIDPGVWQGLFGRFRCFFKCLGVYALMVLKILAWALIAIPIGLVASFTAYYGGIGILGSVMITASLIPAILAVIRYCFAPFYMAEDPKRGVRECIRLSKQATFRRKAAVFGVMFIFVFFNLLAMMLTELLSGMGVPQAVMIVLGLAIDLFINVYAISTLTALFDVMAHPEVEAAMHEHMRTVMKAQGMDDETIDRMIRGRRDEGAVPPEKQAEDEEDENRLN